MANHHSDSFFSHINDNINWNKISEINITPLIIGGNHCYKHGLGNLAPSSKFAIQDLLWTSKKKRTTHKKIGPWSPHPGAKTWPHWPHIAQAVLNRRLVVLAMPETGKTYLVKSLLIGALQTHHPIIINIAPAPTLGEAQHRFLSDVCYFSWDEFTTYNILDQIMVFQQQRMRSYKYLYNTEDMLLHWKALINKIDKILPAALLRTSHNLTQQAHASLRSVKINSPQADLIRERYQTEMRKFYTNIIFRHRRKLMESSLMNTMERAALSLVGIEPHIVLVFDDLGESLKNYTRLTDLWIKQRHLNIGLIIIGHVLKRQIPTTVRLNTSAWIIHGANIFRTLVDEQLVPSGPDKMEILQRPNLIANAPRKFLVFGELIEKNQIYMTECEYQSNEPAYPFLSDERIEALHNLRDPLVNNGNYITFLQRFWNWQFLYAHELLLNKSEL